MVVFCPFRAGLPGRGLTPFEVAAMPFIQLKHPFTHSRLCHVDQFGQLQRLKQVEWSDTPALRRAPKFTTASDAFLFTASFLRARRRSKAVTTRLRVRLRVRVTIGCLSGAAPGSRPRVRARRARRARLFMVRQSRVFRKRRKFSLCTPKSRCWNLTRMLRRREGGCARHSEV